MKGANLINVKPRDPEPVAQPNINIVTGGGKRFEADVGTSEQPTIIRKASLKKYYDPNEQKEYYIDVVELFRQLISSKCP